MAQVYPFRAFRYNPERAPFDRVLTQPYDKISPAMQEKYYAADPHNLIAVEKGRAYPDDTPQNNVYTRAGAAIEDWIRNNIIVQDSAPSFYAYTQEYAVPETEERCTRADLSARESWKNIPRGSLPHEHTLSGPKADRWSCCGTRRCTRGSFSCCTRIRSGALMEFWRRPNRPPRLPRAGDHAVSSRSRGRRGGRFGLRQNSINAPLRIRVQHEKLPRVHLRVPQQLQAVGLGPGKRMFVAGRLPRGIFFQLSRADKSAPRAAFFRFRHRIFLRVRIKTTERNPAR